MIGHEGAITSLKSFSNILASSSEDKSIKIWFNSLKQLIENKKAHRDSITAICVLKNGLIATGSEDRTIKIWKKINETLLENVFTCEELDYPVNALIELKNQSLVSGSESIKVWNQNPETSFKCVATLYFDHGVWSLAIFGNNFLLSGHSDGSILIRNQTSFVLLQKLQKQHKSAVGSIIVLNNGNIASGSLDRTIMIWQKINETSFKFYKKLTEHTSSVVSVAV